MNDIITQDHESTTANQLLRLALDKNCDVDKLRELLELKREEEREIARRAYFDARAQFQSLAPTLVKNVAAHNSEYIPLGDIARQIQPALEQTDLSYRFDIQDSGDMISVSTIVSHRLGHCEATSMTAPADTSGSKNEVQSRGSTVTYLQRYTLIAALGLTTADKDIDGRLESETVSEGQAASLKARLEYTGSNVERFCHMLSIPNIDAMPAHKYAQADRLLTAKESKIARELPHEDD